jgi:hypothetical protein
MILAGAFAIVLFVGLIVGDWMYFARLSSDASRYGYGIGRVQDRFAALTIPQLLRTFDQNGFSESAPRRRTGLSGGKPDGHQADPSPLSPCGSARPGR